jgi:transcriptional regulator with XRE-family HTH domain
MVLKEDKYIGQKLKQRRTELGISQASLAKAVNVSFQQIQKYEKGGNRISASRLHIFARKLFVPITYFFEELNDLNAENNIFQESKQLNQELKLLNSAFLNISNKFQRNSVVTLAKSLAKNNNGTTDNNSIINKNQKN